MSTDTVLTPSQVHDIAIEAGCDPEYDDGALVGRLASAIEQAVLQSEQVQAWNKKAAMIDLLEQHHGADISILLGGEWEVCGSDIYGIGATLAEAFDAAMEQQK